MKLSEYRQLVTNLSDEQKNAILIDLYKRQDKGGKELVETIAQCIKEKKEVPNSKAYIPNFTALEKDTKKFGSWIDDTTGWYYRRVSSKYRKMGRNILKELANVPVQASAAFDQALEIEKYIFQVCASSEAREFPWPEAFKMIGTTRDDLYRKICQMSFEKGYSVETLYELIKFTCMNSNNTFGEVLESFEIFCTFLKNGDLRFEVLELCEDKIREFGRALPGESDRLEDSELTLSVFKLSFLYLLLDSQEADEETARKDLENMTTAAFAKRAWVLYTLAAKEVNRKFEQKI